MKNKKLNVYFYLMFISIFVIVVCSFILLKPPTETKTNPKNWVLFDNTVYTEKPIWEIETLVIEKGISNDDMSSSERSFFLKSLKYDSISRVDGVDISINLPDDEIIIKYKSEVTEDDKDLIGIYNSLVNEIYENKTIYRPLLSQLSYNSDGKIENIVLDLDKNEIRITYPGLGNKDIDVRFLDLPYRTTSLRENTGNLKLYDYKGQDINIGVVFKPEAVYGQAVTNEGLDALRSVAQLNNLIFKDSNNQGIYQIVDYSDVIDTVKEDKTYNGRVKELKIEQLTKGTPSQELTIFLESDAIKFESVIIELLESCGYGIKVSECKEGSDLIVGYTWMYSNSFQSSLNSNLNDAISTYCLGFGETEAIQFMFRSSWILDE